MYSLWKDTDYNNNKSNFPWEWKEWKMYKNIKEKNSESMDR